MAKAACAHSSRRAAPALQQHHPEELGPRELHAEVLGESRDGWTPSPCMPVMSDNSGNRASKMSLPEWDHTLETPLFDRANESLRIRRPNDSNGTAVLHFWSRSRSAEIHLTRCRQSHSTDHAWPAPPACSLNSDSPWPSAPPDAESRRAPQDALVAAGRRSISWRLLRGANEVSRPSFQTLRA